MQWSLRLYKNNAFMIMSCRFVVATFKTTWNGIWFLIPSNSLSFVS